MKRHIAYAKYVLLHKWYVLLEGFRLGVPLWRLIIHDWDKFLPGEWIPYANAFYTADGKRQYVPSLEFDLAWNAHEKRNKHHWQYYVLVRDTGVIVTLPIPYTHFLEMLTDWKSVGQAIGKPNTRLWWEENKRRVYIHSRTRYWIEMMI